MSFAIGCFWYAEKGDSAMKGEEVMPGERVKKRKGERGGDGPSWRREGGREEGGRREGGREGYSKMSASAGKPV